MRMIPCVPARLALLLCVTVAGATGAFAQARQLTSDKAGMMVLDSARRAYNEGKYDFAGQRFREFLSRHGGHNEAPAAWYGLGLSLLKSAKEDDLKGAVEAFRQASDRGDFADRPFAIYYMGVAERDLAACTLAKPATEKQSAYYNRSTADRYFEGAARHFASAVDAFIARSKLPPTTTAPAQSLDFQWAARARCDQCDALLRIRKYKQVLVLARAFLDDKTMGKGPLRSRVLYHLGYAHFAMKDYLAAGRALSRLAPFAQEFGGHARYLLARTHHLSRELPEAAALYKALVDKYEQDKKAAVQAMKNPRALPPDQRARAEALANAPPPNYVVKASFYAALLLAESGRLADALAGFTAFAQQHPKSPLAPEAQLRQGYCHLQLRDYAEATKVLHPLRQHPKLSDRAMWWLARARVGSADPANTQAYAQALRAALGELNNAAKRAYELAGSDPRAKVRYGDILLELGDTQQLAGQYKEAASTYQKVVSYRYNPDRTEEAMQRLATAMHLGGDYSRSDEVCNSFEKTYPKSTLLPAVWFRKAENACMAAMHARTSRYRSRRQDLDRMFKEAIRRYRRLLDKFPDFVQADLARYGMATAHYQLGQYAEALEALPAIPDTNRTGELAAVAYLMADCHIRMLPPKTDDALKAARLIYRAGQAASLLEGFLSAQAKDPKAPDALLKLGHCYQRIGAVLADAGERKKMFTRAKQTYERLLQQFGSDPLRPAAYFERAKCMALLGDTQTAKNELERFRRDPYRSSPVAPLALIRLASLLRAQNRAAEAARILHEFSTRHKSTMRRDSARSDWVPLLQYEHATAMKESGKLAEARAMFEAIAKQFAGRPEGADALWRAGQCRREELMAALAASRNIAGKPGASREQISAASRAVEQSLNGLRQAAESFKVQTEAFGKSMKGTKPHLRMIYETAWCYRVLGDREVESARGKLQKEALLKVLSRLRKKRRDQPAPVLNPPAIPLRDIPVQPSEKLAREQYAALVAAAPEAPLAVRTRFELAEMLAQRERNAEAIELLETALESNPPKELAQQIRLRLAACLLDGNDPTAALAQIQFVAAKATGSLSGQVRYLTGEAYIRQKDWAKAIEQLLPFSDKEPFRSMTETGLADRALLRLGHAYAQAGRWEDSRRALETLASRFARSPWIHEARYGIGRAWENQKQYDQAVNAYGEVIRRTAAEAAARAQLQVGLCRMAQRQFPQAAKDLLVVAYTYDYPEYTAQAWCEAGRAYLEMKQPDEAAKLWNRVVKDYSSSRWAKVAGKHLSALKK